MQQQQATATVRDAQAKLQAIIESCMQRMQSDRDLDPIRNKVELIRQGTAGAPPPAMLTDQSRPTQQEKVALGKWEGMREACVQEQMRYGLSLSLSPNLEPLRDKLLLTGRQLNEQTGLLVAALYDGRLTYGQFAAERMKNMDQTIGHGTTTHPVSDQLNLTSASAAPGIRDQIPLRKQGN
jgi:hypothetical protein